MEHGRLLTDSTGVEWEVYDESSWTIAWAIDWDCRPKTDDPGLLFESVRGTRRVHPCPMHWRALTDAQLEALLRDATTLM